MKHASQVAVLCLLVCLALTVFLSAAPTSSNARFNLYSWVVDEQTNVGCYSTLTDTPYLTGEFTSDPAAVGPTSAYALAPWTSVSDASVAYVNRADCTSTSTCLSVGFNKNQTAFSIDTRISQDPTTGSPRKVLLNFGQPCDLCAYGPGPANPFGTNPVATSGLLSVFLTVPYTSMAICSSTDCPESESGTARFWFDDPAGTKTSWRVDWGFIRVLRVSATTWYVIADGCDGSQVATLYRLSSGRKGSTSRLGQYRMPFFAAATQ